MKTRLYVAACVFLSFSIFSCSTDDIDQQTEASGNNLKKEVQKNGNENIYARAKDTINASTNTTEGDPIIVKPPRKD
ncbi:hypothetical protein BC749_10353 [Flavobacterium araucananum]|uniref:Uncharacterized protein n=1 Tax=Flavobacterium araucananum TaxID=946678 RepID=A0A227PGX9_9FLAO|nr:hypothetical protein [Flavobacterium araucananum]OXG09129.1 hypothetical protein B0A64_03805 [Flavobacterium araucananum]PWJ99675.1 hypothetical protein BC749_10353 [Flavobacterium araucananum]